MDNIAPSHQNIHLLFSCDVENELQLPSIVINNRAEFSKDDACPEPKPGRHGAVRCGLR